MITKIKITNIKGFGATNNDLDVNILNSKINILVAPNGFGKTSLTTAFKCVAENGARLVVPPDFIFMKNENLKPVFRVTEDGTTYVADHTKNEIAQNFNCQVINNLVKADTRSFRVAGIQNTKGFLSIAEVVLGNAIAKPVSPYKIKVIRATLDKNGKVLMDMSSFLENLEFLESMLALSDVFVKFKAQKRQDLIGAIVTDVNAAKGTVEDITSNVDLSKIESDEYYQCFANALKKHQNAMTDWEVFSAFWQMRYMFEHEKNWLKKQRDYLSFLHLRKRLDENIRDFNSSWKVDLKSVVEAKNLKVKFPKADELSNGQRDVLAFIVQLMNAKNRLKANKKNIIIIDEIFDYMDDANLTAAQYYLTKYLSVSQGKLYIIILTHLDPVYFKNYVFSSKKMNICYLSRQAIELSEEMKAFLCFRNGIKKDTIEAKELYNDISKYYFHYNPTSKDLTGSVHQRPHLQTNWFKEDNLKVYLVGETNKYLSDQNDYDPYSVCLAIRIRVEKLAYETLESQADKDAFIAAHKTKEKLMLAESCGATIPDSYYVMGVIYNDAEHLRENNYDKNCIYKLYNMVIKNIIKEFFSYVGNPITLSYLK